MFAARTFAPAPASGAEGLRVAAYNVRMGFGMDGRFSVTEQAEALPARRVPGRASLPHPAGETGSDQQIDHVLHTGDLAPSDPANPDVPHSDHRPVAATLTPVA